MRGLTLLLPVAFILAASFGRAEPPKKYQVVTPRDVDISATGINERGEIVGFDSVEDKARPGVIDQVPFFARGKELIHLPLLDGYTSTFTAALSDDGLVVGTATRPVVPGKDRKFNTLAITWDPGRGIRGVGVAEDDLNSFATGITRDGRRISGYTVGPDRIRACVWDREGEGWRITVLPHAARLGSNTVAISGDGRFVAAVDGAAPCLWSRDASGKWTRESIGDAGTLVPRSVNNAGAVVGVRFTTDGLTHAVAWSRSGGIRLLPKPEGYVRSEALSINNQGVIVGMIDGPNASKTGPNAFAEEGGRLRILDEGGPNFASATAINDHGQVAGVMETKEE